MQKRVVITGIGAWSCIGNSLDTITHSLKNGISGIGTDESRIAMGFHSSLTGIIPKPDLSKFLDRRTRMSLAQQTEYAYMATKDALALSNIDMTYLDNNEVGIIFGNDSSGKAVVESYKTMENLHDSYLLGSNAVFQSMNSTVSMSLGTIFPLRGINFTLSAACSSSSHAIGMAYLLIKHGLQDIILCGGAQEVNPTATASFDGLDVFSKRMQTPKKASRPFDKFRDGLVPSGGAATVILEEYDHAIKRNAPILAEIVGYGFSSSGKSISHSDVTSCKIAIERALNDANLIPNDIDYINAHATSTPIGDDIEAQTLSLLFCNNKTMISSTKSMTGHECWMAGASEIVYTLLMMKNDFIAPNINIEQIDTEAEKLKIVTETTYEHMKLALSNSFGFGGTNSAIIIKNI